MNNCIYFTLLICCLFFCVTDASQPTGSSDIHKLQAGFGKTEIEPLIGTKFGYGNKSSTGVRGPLYVRALVIERDGLTWCVLSLDLIGVHKPLVEEFRKAVASATGIPGDNVFIAATHTHSAPAPWEPDNFHKPLSQFIVDAATAAWEVRQPVRIASGYGFLDGHTLNRRWIHRPVDPAVTVIRFDDLKGKTLGLLTNFSCHALVLGPDNLEISADFPGSAMTELEKSLGDNAICLYTQGGAGDVTPLTTNVRAKLESGIPVRVNAHGTVSYYGSFSPDNYNPGVRGGDTYEDVEVFGLALSNEALQIANGLIPVNPEGEVWSESRQVSRSGKEDDEIMLEIMAVGIEGQKGIVLMGIPGEIFSETSMFLRREAEKMGYRFPIVISYANGGKSYIPPQDAFSEGGYEVKAATRFGYSPDIQERIWDALKSILTDHAP